jgi:hypothetical protein
MLAKEEVTKKEKTSSGVRFKGVPEWEEVNNKRISKAKGNKRQSLLELLSFIFSKYD